MFSVLQVAIQIFWYMRNAGRCPLFGQGLQMRGIAVRSARPRLASSSPMNWRVAAQQEGDVGDDAEDDHQDAGFDALPKSEKSRVVSIRQSRVISQRLGPAQLNRGPKYFRNLQVKYSSAKGRWDRFSNCPDWETQRRQTVVLEERRFRCIPRRCNCLAGFLRVRL
jgi:hypothetical protein